MVNRIANSVRIGVDAGAGRRAVNQPGIDSDAAGTLVVSYGNDALRGGHDEEILRGH